MKKTVCPKCGGTLIIEDLCQYGILREVCKNGKIRKKIKKVDRGSMEFQYLFCSSCKYCFQEGEFAIRDNCIELTEVE